MLLTQFLLRTIFLVTLLSVFTDGKVCAQEPLKYNAEVIVEFKNFTEEKVLPSLNQSFVEKGGVKVDGYCPYQDLIIFQYNTNVYPTAEDLLVTFEKMGYTVYLKFDMDRDILNKECKSEFKKL